MIRSVGPFYNQGCFIQVNTKSEIKKIGILTPWFFRLYRNAHYRIFNTDTENVYLILFEYNKFKQYKEISIEMINSSGNWLESSFYLIDMVKNDDYWNEFWNADSSKRIGKEELENLILHNRSSGANNIKTRSESVDVISSVKKTQ